jgi:uncharacterized protein
VLENLGGHDAAAAAAKDVAQRLIVVHSDSAVSPEGVRDFVSKVPHPVEQVWLPDVSQFDFYDQAGPMNTAADAATKHFLRTA